MWLVQVTRFLDKLSKPIVKAGSYVAEVILALLVVLTAIDVFLRNIDLPIMGTYDLTELSMVVLTSLGVGYCAYLKGHIKVEVVLEKLPKWAQKVFNIIAIFVSFGITSIFTWQVFVNMQMKFHLHLTTGVLLIPIYPFVGLLCFGMALFSLVLLKDFLESISPEGR